MIAFVESVIYGTHTESAQLVGGSLYVLGENMATREWGSKHINLSDTASRSWLLPVGKFYVAN